MNDDKLKKLNLSKKSGVILNLDWVHNIFFFTFICLLTWLNDKNYVSMYKVCVCKLFSNVCLLTSKIKLLIKQKSHFLVSAWWVITFFLREIFDIETRFCGRVRGQNFYNSFYNKLLVHCRGAGVSKILVRTSLYDGHNLPVVRIKVII